MEGYIRKETNWISIIIPQLVITFNVFIFDYFPFTFSTFHSPNIFHRGKHSFRENSLYASYIRYPEEESIVTFFLRIHKLMELTLAVISAVQLSSARLGMTRLTPETSEWKLFEEYSNIRINIQIRREKNENGNM